MVIEIIEGRGCGPEGDHVKLKLDHLGEEVLNSRLPGILEPPSVRLPMLIQLKNPSRWCPTCHYMMGGIPTQVSGQALTQDAVWSGCRGRGLIRCRRSRLCLGPRRESIGREFVVGLGRFWSCSRLAH